MCDIAVQVGLVVEWNEIDLHADAAGFIVENYICGRLNWGWNQIRLDEMRAIYI